MKKILIVDDSQFMRIVLKDLITNKNNKIHFLDKIDFFEADGKNSAISQLKVVNPDLILLDIVMKESEIEGIRFIEEIKDYFPTKKIIVISSLGQSFLINKCKQLGISNYFQKPFEHNKIIDAINQVLVN
ncbi:MAG: response regulator [Gammaproteobacteria bacterium]|nr:MAG: response regulator [Gammaproteobacteria bacterium]